MNEEQRAAFLNSQVACTMIRAMGMQAENMKRVYCGQDMAYTEVDFQILLRDSGIEYNSALETLTGR